MRSAPRHPTTPRPAARKRTPSLLHRCLVEHLHVWRFLIPTASLLALCLVLAHRQAPRRPTLADLIQALSSPPTPELPWWKRLFTDLRPRRPPQPARRRDVASDSGELRAVPDSVPPMTPEQIAFRQFTLAQLIMAQRFDRTEREALSAVSTVPFNGPFRHYEQNRFLTEMLWLRYLDRIDREATARGIRKHALAALDYPAANFEDRLNAGVGLLLTGDAERAIPQLQAAVDQWPAMDRMRGNAYLALMAAHAARDHHRQTLFMLAGFQRNFPDWLNVENYLPDLIDLEATYDNPLLALVHGRILQLVHDFQGASEKYRDALDRGLPPSAASMARHWLSETGEVQP